MDKEKMNFISLVAEMFLLREFVPSEEVREFIACQFALESDFGHSRRSLLSSNISGMKVPYLRYSVRVGSIDGFSSYECWYDCMKDYLLWIFYNRPYQNTFDSVQNYSTFLRDRGYCPEKDYIKKIQSIYNQFINSKPKCYE